MTVPWWKTRLGDSEGDAARNAVVNGKISQGAITAELEERLAEALSVPHVTMTTSGSVALLMALIASGVKPGDEVIVPNRTFIATAHAVQLLGAEVRLVDTLPHLPIMDPEMVDRAITSRTKAMIPVHLNGRACHLTALRDMAERKGIRLIEDAAQALFSKHEGRCLGTFGDFGCFSLGVTKLMTSGQGGFVVTGDPRLHERLQFLRTHGVHSPLDESFDRFGFNFRYTDIQAAIALEQLQTVPRKKKAHLDLYGRYEERLRTLSCARMLPVDTLNGEIPLWMEIISPQRDRLHDFFSKRGVETRKAVPNLNVSPHLRDPGAFPNASFFERHLLTLPSGPDQEEEDIRRTLELLSEFEVAFGESIECDKG